MSAWFIKKGDRSLLLGLNSPAAPSRSLLWPVPPLFFDSTFQRQEVASGANFNRRVDAPTCRKSSPPEFPTSLNAALPEEIPKKKSRVPESV